MKPQPKVYSDGGFFNARFVKREPFVYVRPEHRKAILSIWSYPMLRAAFDASTGDMRDDIAAEMAKRGGQR